MEVKGEKLGSFGVAVLPIAMILILLAEARLSGLRQAMPVRRAHRKLHFTIGFAALVSVHTALTADDLTAEAERDPDVRKLRSAGVGDDFVYRLGVVSRSRPTFSALVALEARHTSNGDCRPAPEHLACRACHGAEFCEDRLLGDPLGKLSH